MTNVPYNPISSLRSDRGWQILWSQNFIIYLEILDLYYQGMGGMVKCCAVDGCNTGIASPADSNSNRFTQNPNNNIPTRFTQNPINPNPTAPTIQQMNEFISNLPAELPGAPLGSFLQQPFNTNQQPTFLNQQAFISSNPQVSFFLNIFLVMAPGDTILTRIFSIRAGWF